MTVMTAPARDRRSSRTGSIVDLSGDDLPLPVPPHIREAAKRALDEGATHYTTRPGLDPLREAIAVDLQEHHGIDVDPKSEVLITCGTREALFVSLHVLLSPGDEAVIPTPADPIHATLVRDAHGKPRFAPGDPASGFTLDVDAVRRAITRRSRILVLPNPATPAGTVPEMKALTELRDLAVAHNLAVITPESYRQLAYDRTPISIGSLPGMAERTLTIGSFSVPYGMSGWRVGYIAGSRELMGPVMKLKQALSICSPAVSQYAALAALTGPQDWLQEARQALAARRDAVSAALQSAGIPHVRPQAGPFLLLSGERTGRRGTELARWVYQASGVRLAAGSRFGMVRAPWLRWTLLETAEPPAAIVRRLAPLLRSQGGEPA